MLLPTDLRRGTAQLSSLPQSKPVLPKKEALGRREFRKRKKERGREKLPIVRTHHMHDFLRRPRSSSSRPHCKEDGEGKSAFPLNYQSTFTFKILITQLITTCPTPHHVANMLKPKLSDQVLSYKETLRFSGILMHKTSDTALSKYATVMSQRHCKNVIRHSISCSLDFISSFSV